MGIRRFFQEMKESFMTREAKLNEAMSAVVPQDSMLLGLGVETEWVLDSLAHLVGRETEELDIASMKELLGAYVQVVQGYLFDGVSLHDIKGRLLANDGGLISSGNIDRLVAFCVMHAGDTTFFMRNENAEEQLEAMLETL